MGMLIEMGHRCVVFEACSSKCVMGFLIVKFLIKQYCLFGEKQGTLVNYQL